MDQIPKKYPINAAADAAPGQDYPEPCLRVLLHARQLLRAGRWHYANLSAPFWRFYWNAGRGACVTIAGTVTHLDPGYGYVLPPNASYATDNRRDVDHFYLHFITRAPYNGVAPGLYSFPTNPTMKNAIAALAPSAGARMPDTPAGAAVAAYFLAYHALAAVPTGKFGVPPGDPRIQRVLAEMEAHPEHDVHNDDWAARAGMNTNAFIRLFKMQTGLTPGEYLRQKRVEQACLLLRFTDRKLEDIAAATGFCDRYHLTRIFRKERGMGPAAFRRIRA